MKSKHQNLTYCDITAIEDCKLSLIGNLLIQTGESLEVQDVKEIGFLILEYLSKKSMTDNLFFGRSLTLCKLNENEKKGYSAFLSAFVKANEKS